MPPIRTSSVLERRREKARAAARRARIEVGLDRPAGVGHQNSVFSALKRSASASSVVAVRQDA